MSWRIMEQLLLLALLLPLSSAAPDDAPKGEAAMEQTLTTKESALEGEDVEWNMAEEDMEFEDDDLEGRKLGHCASIADRTRAPSLH